MKIDPPASWIEDKKKEQQSPADQLASVLELLGTMSDRISAIENRLDSVESDIQDIDRILGGYRDES